MAIDRNTPDSWLPDLCGQPIALLRILLFSIILALILVLLRSGIVQFDWPLLGGTALLIVWVSILVTLGLCRMRSFVASSSNAVGVLLAFCWVLFVTTLCTYVSYWLLLDQFGLSSQSVFSAIVENNVIALLLSAILFRYCFVTYELRKRDIAASQARLEALQARIEPHFLFNSMNTIISLISEDPSGAEQAALDLSDLFRAALREGAEPVSLEFELQLCEKYLSIEKLRMGDRLSWNFEVEPALRDLQLPSLTLQPMLENAILHGLQPLSAGGAINLKVETQGKNVVLLLTNPCPEPSANDAASTSPSGKSMGLENIRARLESYFSDSVEAGGEVKFINGVTHFEMTVRFAKPTEASE